MPKRHDGQEIQDFLQSTKSPKFKKGSGPEDPDNQQAAKERGLKFDPEKNAYVDAHGNKLRNRDGEHLNLRRKYFKTTRKPDF